MTSENGNFWLFGGDRYEPSGGMGDLIGSYATLALAQAASKSARNDLDGLHDWFHVVDVLRGPEIVWENADVEGGGLCSRCGEHEVIPGGDFCGSCQTDLENPL